MFLVGFLTLRGLENVERKASVKEEQNDMSSIIEKLKSQRRASNSSSVSQTSTTGAIESTSGVNLDVPEVKQEVANEEVSKDDESSKDDKSLSVTEIPVAFGSDNEASDKQTSSMLLFTFYSLTSRWL